VCALRYTRGENAAFCPYHWSCACLDCELLNYTPPTPKCLVSPRIGCIAALVMRCCMGTCTATGAIHGSKPAAFSRCIRCGGVVGILQLGRAHCQPCHRAVCGTRARSAHEKYLRLQLASACVYSLPLIHTTCAQGRSIDRLPLGVSLLLISILGTLVMWATAVPMLQFQVQVRR
jgi:hypothetical protein